MTSLLLEKDNQIFGKFSSDLVTFSNYEKIFF